MFIWISHQPHIRLTLIDALNRIVIADHIIPRENFNRDHVKMFLSTSLNGLDVKYIITDGDRIYPGIIAELGYIQQRCTFHVMKNLMDSLSKRHNSLKRKIKRLDEEIPKKEAKLKELETVYVGVKGKCKKDDKKKLRKEISQLKAKRRRY